MSVLHKIASFALLSIWLSSKLTDSDGIVRFAIASEHVDYYQTLGIPKNATKSQIKKAYHELARKYHPDNHGGVTNNDLVQKMSKVNEAHDVLINPTKRQQYDQFGIGASGPTGSGGPGGRQRGGFDFGSMNFGNFFDMGNGKAFFKMGANNGQYFVFGDEGGSPFGGFGQAGDNRQAHNRQQQQQQQHYQQQQQQRARTSNKALFADSNVIEPSDADINAAIYEHNWPFAIVYYHSNCSHCHDLAPTYKTLAIKLKEVVQLYAVNCGNRSQLCTEKKIRGYPTIMYYNHLGDAPTKYEGARDERTLGDWLLARLPNVVTEIYSYDAFESFLSSNPQNAKFIFFTNKGYVAPIVKKLAYNFRRTANIGILLGSIGETTRAKICAKLNCPSTYPAMLYLGLDGNYQWYTDDLATYKNLIAIVLTKFGDHSAAYAKLENQRRYDGYVPELTPQSYKNGLCNQTENKYCMILVNNHTSNSNELLSILKKLSKDYVDQPIIVTHIDAKYTKFLKPFNLGTNDNIFVYRPKKSRYMIPKLLGKDNEKEIKTFAENLLDGNSRFHNQIRETPSFE